MVTDIYQDLQLRIEQEIIETPARIEITVDGIDLEQAGLRQLGRI
jgi:hypothetical protein